jgi:hypothetical protein
VIADECQGYIGETDGYSNTTVGEGIWKPHPSPKRHASASCSTPTGGAEEVFDQIEVFSVDDPEVKRYVPERVVVLVRVCAPQSLLSVYGQLGRVAQRYQRRIREIYGPEHLRKYCKEHGLCVGLLSLKMLSFGWWRTEPAASSGMALGN